MCYWSSFCQRKNKNKRTKKKQWQHQTDSHPSFNFFFFTSNIQKYKDSSLLFIWKNDIEEATKWSTENNNNTWHIWKGVGATEISFGAKPIFKAKLTIWKGDCVNSYKPIFHIDNCICRKLFFFDNLHVTCYMKMAASTYCSCQTSFKMFHTNAGTVTTRAAVDQRHWSQCR